MKKSNLKALALTFAIGTLLTGCSTFLGAESQSNLDRLEQGMSEASVLSLLGHPDSVVQKGENDRWIYEFRRNENNGHNVFVDFKSGSVTRSGELSGRDIAAAEVDRESGTCTRWVKPEFRFESLCTR